MDEMTLEPRKSKYEMYPWEEKIVDQLEEHVKELIKSPKVREYVSVWMSSVNDSFHASREEKRKRLEDLKKDPIVERWLRVNDALEVLTGYDRSILNDKIIPSETTR